MKHLVTGLTFLIVIQWVGGGPFAMRPAAAQAEIDPQRPDRHFSIDDPAGLTGADALSIYERILKDMIAGYGLSGMSFSDSYTFWPRVNTVPYRSAQHGQRFVNNYTNEAARAYRMYERSGPMPEGAVLVKDSFAVTQRGDVFSGPLFVMEKMPRGFSPKSRDWRYTMIMPDGSLFGTTKGEGGRRVEFCITCHAVAGDDHDHLFYVPEEFRIRLLD